MPEEELGRNRVLLTTCMLGGEVVYLNDGAQATLGQNIKANFRNDGGVAVKMARMVVCGVDGSELEARTEAARLRKRQGGCGHEH